MVMNQAPMSWPWQLIESMRRRARTNVSEVRSSASCGRAHPVVEVAIDRVDVAVVDLAERLAVALLGRPHQCPGRGVLGVDVRRCRLVSERGSGNFSGAGSLDESKSSGGAGARSTRAGRPPAEH